MQTGEKTGGAPLLHVDKLNAALLVAAKQGRAAAVRELLSQGANADASDGHGAAVYWAARGGHVQTMEALADGGADLDRANPQGATPLMFAGMKGHVLAVEWLLRRGAEWRTVDERGQSTLEYAKQWGHTETATVLREWITQHGSEAEVSELKRDLNALLIRTATTGETALLKEYLKQGADPNTTDDQGWTGLFWAASAHHSDLDAMEALVSAGADVNWTDWRGWTPLMATVEQAVTANWLLQNGAEWRQTDKDGKDALTLARERGHTEVVSLLREWAASAADSTETVGTH
jgi:ankyrin repeat protein